MCVHIDAKANITHQGENIYTGRNIYKKNRRKSFIKSTSHTHTHSNPSTQEESRTVGSMDWIGPQQRKHVQQHPCATSCVVCKLVKNI